MKRYFISYAYQDKNGHGFSNCEMEVTGNFTCLKDFDPVHAKIMHDMQQRNGYAYDSIVILNWRQFE